MCNQLETLIYVRAYECECVCECMSRDCRHCLEEGSAIQKNNHWAVRFIDGYENVYLRARKDKRKACEEFVFINTKNDATAINPRRCSVYRLNRVIAA